MTGSTAEDYPLGGSWREARTASEMPSALQRFWWALGAERFPADGGRARPPRDCKTAISDPLD